MLQGTAGRALQGLARGVLGRGLAAGQLLADLRRVLLQGLVPGLVASAALRGALSRLQGGRLWIDGRGGAMSATCAGLTCLELDSAVPLAGTRGIGAHLGFAWQVARRLNPAAVGLRRRAEVLGISRKQLRTKMKNFGLLPE